MHPVSGRYTAAGQGAITLELLKQLPDVDEVIVPIGGGDLITGISFTKPACPYGKLVPEGAAVLPLSAVSRGKCSVMDSIVLICSGSDIDRSVLTACLQGELKDCKMAYMHKYLW